MQQDMHSEYVAAFGDLVVVTIKSARPSHHLLTWNIMVIS